MLSLRSLRSVRLPAPATCCCSRFSTSTSLLEGRALRPTSARKIILGMKGQGGKDLKSLHGKHRLTNNLTTRGNVHPDLIRPSRHSRFNPNVDPSRNPFPSRFIPPTAGMKKPPAANHPKRGLNPNNLVMGTSSVVHTVPIALHAERSKVHLTTEERVEARKDFEFRSEPMQRLPVNASKFASHPTLTGLPQHFSHPPLRPGLFTSIHDYLEASQLSDRSVEATPIQRLVLSHFFPPRNPTTAPSATSPTPSESPKKYDQWVQNKKDWVPKGMLPGSKTLLAAETGSGKTLAYMMPVITGLKQSEEAKSLEVLKEEAPREKSWFEEDEEEGVKLDDTPVRLKPRALILAPTHELARQIAQTFKTLTHHEKLRVGCLSVGGAGGSDNGAYGLPPDCDVLVGTMNRVRDLMGLKVLRDSKPDRRVAEREEAALKKLIDREKEQAKKWKDAPYLGKDLPTEDGRQRWMPDKRLTWEENLRAREGLDGEDAKGEEKPSWAKVSERAQERRSKKWLSLENVEWLVIDEADVALDRDFAGDLLPVIEPLMKRKDTAPVRTIFATATVPETLTKFLQQRHPETVRLITPNLHKLPHNLSVARVAWSGGNWLPDVLMEIRRAFVEDARDGNPASQILVFANKNSKAEDLGEYLNEKGWGNKVITSESKGRVRGSNKHVSDFLLDPRTQLKGLIEAKHDPASHLPVKPPPKTIGNRIDINAPDPEPSQPRVLITTGLLSRGLDFSPNVSTILMLDEPTNAVDFLHRAGRAGRAGAMGRVVVFSKSHKASMNALPAKAGNGGAGRGGAIWQTVKAARARFEGKRGKKPPGKAGTGKRDRSTWHKR